LAITMAARWLLSKVWVIGLAFRIVSNREQPELVEPPQSADVVQHRPLPDGAWPSCSPTESGFAN
jgi:hypothetical protein